MVVPLLTKKIVKKRVKQSSAHKVTGRFLSRSELQVMEHLVSSRCNGRSLRKSYIFPLEQRPGNFIVPPADDIPEIDLAGHDQTDIIRQILEASEKFGFFQVINHGVPKLDEAMSAFKEFHALSGKDKAFKTSKDPNKSCVFYSSSLKYKTEKFHFWRDVLKHHGDPLKDCIQFWPEQPPRYREVVGLYTAEVSKLESKILGFIFQGLGISLGERDGIQTLAVNHYPPCPDPSLTLGLGKHVDLAFINILLQSDVHGLQVFKDEEWIGVVPNTKALVVNIGYPLQIISNGKLKGAEHRVVTNPNVARTTASYYLSPSAGTLIEPAKSLVDASHPARYKSLTFEELRVKYEAASGDTKALEEAFSTTV